MMAQGESTLQCTLLQLTLRSYTVTMIGKKLFSVDSWK